jgi:type II secretory pathway pseudopilin PulG
VTDGRPVDGDRGYIMVALLVGMAIAAVWMSALLPTWRQQTQRQKETDLIFRGEQYARAIALFAVKNNGALPQSIDDLVSQNYLRKKWKDPITGKDFQVIGSGAVGQPAGSAPGPGRAGSPATPQQQAGGAAGVRGVFSESTNTSIRIYNNAQQYNQWIFDYQAALLRMGRLGGPAQGGRPGDRAGGPARGGNPRGGPVGPRGAGPGGRGPGGTPPIGAGGPARGGGS